MKKQIKILIRKSCGGGEWDDWFNELADDLLKLVRESNKKARLTERNKIKRLLKRLLSWYEATNCDVCGGTQLVNEVLSQLEGNNAEKK